MIESIENREQGSSVRTKLNAAIDLLNSGLASGQAVGLRWGFDVATTSSNPGDGLFKFNGTKTALYLNYKSDTEVIFSDFLNEVASGSFLYIQSLNDTSKYYLLKIDSSITDNTNWFTIPVSISDSSGAFDDEESIGFLFLGDPGPSLDLATYAATHTFDFDNRVTGTHEIPVTGSITCSVSNMAAGGEYLIHLDCDATPRSLTIDSSFGTLLTGFEAVTTTAANATYLILVMKSNSGEVTHTINIKE